MGSYYTNEQALLEEVLGFREMENYYTNQAYLNGGGAINGCWSLESLPNNNNNNNNYANIIPISNSCFGNNYNAQFGFNNNQQTFISSSPYGAAPPPDHFTVDSSSCSRNFDTQTVPYSCPEADNHFFLSGGENDGGACSIYRNGAVDIGGPCKMEMEALPEMPSTNSAFYLRNCPQVVIERKSKVKKLNGQPSKNLMAERRRRKRLNDRLSMLRSVVPKISKMDRTSILGDTIDYMKELIERINGLQKEMHLGSNQLSLMSIFNDVKPNEIVVRNSPKFDVERRNRDTRMEICCGGKPGLLLSTVTTLEALGLQVQQCVISCFNEFSLQASCSEELKKRSILDSEDIRQALLRNAGYGEKCL